jgi:hypothetical protein
MGCSLITRPLPTWVGPKGGEGRVAGPQLQGTCTQGDAGQQPTGNHAEVCSRKV